MIRFHGVLAPNAKLRARSFRREEKQKQKSDVNDDVPHSPASVCICWAHLLKRIFDIDIEHCLSCGGNMRIIAAILEASARTKILGHFNLLHLKSVKKC